MVDLVRKIDLLRNKYGGLIICDEVQTGFDRMGNAYWGHKWQGIKPEIITMAENIGNGLHMEQLLPEKKRVIKLSKYI